jgi:hypothetical protein
MPQQTPNEWCETHYHPDPRNRVTGAMAGIVCRITISKGGASKPPVFPVGQTLKLPVSASGDLVEIPSSATVSTTEEPGYKCVITDPDSDEVLVFAGLCRQGIAVKRASPSS